MADQNLRVNIQFNADNTQAKRSINDLSASLKQISQTEITIPNGSIDQAVKSANQLHQALAQAVNVDTGRLDFTKLQSSLKSLGTDLTSVSANLISLGPQGQQAFNSLVRAIGTAQAPITRLNKTFIEFGKTLVNTIHWQVASSLVHGFIGVVQQAVGYISDLDKSLKGIQIVTQQNDNSMRAFANHARDLAGDLRVATKEFVDASLIFFQQGLSEKDVIARTEAALKLAKVTGESVSNVSSELTAIWNNFDDGSRSLESYADVLTALGAATASSSKEIATGIQKFAAVAETVGLSYEYATAALATVVAETRQSADIVGTAFKTLFSRLEGLKLGETLEDGVDLNKYSEALNKVGVNILDANGNLRQMDDILDNLGEKWQFLTEAQKVALAQTVGGVRQYQQFMALMNNYDKVQSNINIAKNSEGTLEKQYDVYKDSIEAITEAFENSKRRLFDQFINEDSIKDFKQILTEFLNMVTQLVKNLGGAKGVLFFIMTKVISTFMPQIMTGIQNIGHNFMDYWGITERKQVKSLQAIREMVAESHKLQNEATYSDTSVRKADAGIGKESISIAEKLKTLQAEKNSLEDLSLLKRQNLIATARDMLNIDKEHEALTIDEIERQKELLKLSIDKVQAAQTDVDAATRAYSGMARQKYAREQLANRAIASAEENEHQQNIDNLNEEKTNLADISANLNGGNQNIRNGQLESMPKLMQEAVTQSTQEIEKLQEKAKTASEEEKKSIDEEIKRIQDLIKTYQELAKELEEVKNGKKGRSQTKIAEDFIKERKNSINNNIAKETQERDAATARRKNASMNVEDLKAAGKTDRAVGSGTVTADMHASAQASIGTPGAPDNAQALELYKERLTEIFNQSNDINASWETVSGTISVSADTLVKLSQEYGAMTADTNEMSNINQDIVTYLKQQSLLTSTSDKNSKAAKKALADQAQAQKNILKNINQIAGKNTKYSSALTKQVQTLDKNSALWKQIAKAVGKTGDAADELQTNSEEAEKALSELLQKAANGEIHLGSQEMEELMTSIQGVKTQTEEAMQGIGTLGTEVGDQLVQANGNTDEARKKVDQLAESNRHMGQSAEEGVLQAGKSFQTLNQNVKSINFQSITEGFQLATSAASNLKMGIGMLGSATDSLTEIMKGNGDVTQWLNFIMMALQGTTMILNATQSTGILIGKLLGVQKNKETGEWVANTGAVVANSVAKIFNAHASQGIVGVAIALLAVGIVIATMAIVANTNATNENTEARMEMAAASDKAGEQTVKLAKKWREETAAMDELLLRYDRMSDATKNLYSTRQELLEQGKELLEGYEDAKDMFTGDELTAYLKDLQDYKDALALGDIGKMRQARTALDNRIAKPAAEGAQGAAIGKTASVAMDMVKSMRTIAGNDEEVEFLNNGEMRVRIAGKGKKENGEEGFGGALKKALLESGEFESDDFNFGTWGKYGGVEVNFAVNNPLKFEKQYKAFQQAIQGLSKNYGNTEAFRRSSQWMSENNDSINELFENNNTTRDLMSQSSASKMANGGKDVSSIVTLDDFKDYREELINNNVALGLTRQEAIESADAWLKSNEGLTVYADSLEKLTAIENKFGPASREVIESIMDTMSPEELEKVVDLDTDIDWSIIYDEQSFNTARKMAENDIKNTQFQSTIDLVPNIVSKLDKASTKKDFEEIRKEYEKLLKDNPNLNLMDADSFMHLSQRDQKAYLNNAARNSILNQLDLNRQSQYEAYAGYRANQDYINSGYQEEVAEYKLSKANAIKQKERLESERAKYTGRYKLDDYSNTWSRALGDDLGSYNSTGGWYYTDRANYETRDLSDLAGETLGYLKDIGINTSGYESDNGVYTWEQLQAIQELVNENRLNSDEKYTLSQINNGIGEYNSIIATADENMKNANSKFQAAKDANDKIDSGEDKKINSLLDDERDLLAALEANDTQMIKNATSLGELNAAMSQINSTWEDTSRFTDEYQDGLIALAENYVIATDEVLAYQQAIESGNKTLIAQTEDNLRATIMLGEAAEKYSLEATVLEAQSKIIAKEYNITAQKAAQLTIRNQRMNAGVTELNANFKDWKKTIKESNKLSQDYATAIDNTAKALRNLVGASDNASISAEFIEEHLADLERAADGDTDAIARLGNELARAQIDALSFSDAIDVLGSSSAALDQFTNWKDTILTGIDELYTKLSTLEDGANLSDTLGDDWITALNKMAEATHMSVEDMQGMLNSLGVQGVVNTETAYLDRDIPRYVTTIYRNEVEGDFEGGYRTKITETSSTSATGEVDHITEAVQYASLGTVEGGVKKPLIYHSPKSAGGVAKSATSAGKSSGSKKEKKDKKKAESETERYHEITSLIEDYARELDKASKAKDRAFGPKKLKAMQAEIAAQAQLNAATEEHIREIREWLEIDKARIEAQGATFDEYGNISNYTELMQQHIDAYNAAVATYNASEQSDADKEAMETADKAYQDFMDQLSQYEETNDLLQDKLDELIEAQQAKYDREFEMLQYTIEFKIEADDSILSYLDYMKNKIENFNDGVHDAVEMLATLNDEAATLMDKNSTYNRAIDDTLNHYLSNQGMGESDIQAFIDRFKANNMSESDMSMLEDMTEAEYQYLLELKDNLLEINNSLIENMSAVVETVQNSFSKTAEDLDKATRPIERAASALENYAAIIDIVGRDAFGITDAIAAELDNAAVAVAHSATVAAKAKVDTLQSERDEVQRLYDEAMAQGLTEMAYKWKTVLEEMDDEIASATDDFNSKWQEELTKAREAFENTVERIKQSMLDAFAGSIGSWSGLKDSLEYAKTAADRFVPQYKEIYELSKLNRDIMKSIDNTSNIKNKQALRDLQKEINELEQHSGEISQYDLDNARRRYELELARLQLEEARDAKSTVRLSKDAEGNWSYVYTANQEDVEKAEQNYEDKLYAMQQANNEYINSLSDQILELEEQYAEKLAEIRLDNTMSEEERNAAIERLNAYFAEQMEYLTNEGQKAVDNNARLFEEEWITYHNWTDAFGNDIQARIDSQHDFMTQFGDTILGTYTGYGNFDELNAAMVQIAEEASLKMEEAYGALQAQVATAMEAAGIDVAHFGEVVHDTVNDQIVPSAQAAEDAVVEMGKAAVDEFKELTDGVSTWQTKYATEMQKIINKNEQLATSVNNLATAYANLVAQMYAAADAPVPKVPKFNNSNADGYTGTNTGGPGEGNNDSDDDETYTDSAHWQSDNHEHWKVRTYKSGRTKKINKGHHRWYLCDPVMISGHGHSPIAFESAQCAVCGKKISIDPQQPYAYVDGTGDNQEVLIPGYDTGGYTGNWNSSQGKLAVLHEKELVLNKDDTKNILGTVEMVRKLSQKIDLNAQTARYAFNYHPIINDPKPIDRELQVDQTVSITAEFPNVQNRTEIEEAFTTLINQASQFANRKS